MSLRAILLDCGDTVLVEKRYGDRIAVIDEPEAVAGAGTVIPMLASLQGRSPLAYKEEAHDHESLWSKAWRGTWSILRWPLDLEWAKRRRKLAFTAFGIAWPFMSISDGSMALELSASCFI